MTSAKVGQAFVYQDAVRTGGSWSMLKAFARKVTSANTLPGAPGLPVRWPDHFTGAALQAEIRPRCFEGHLPPPPAHEPRHDLERRMVGISPERRLGLPLSLEIHVQPPPTDQYRFVACGVPQTRLSIHLHGPGATAIPSHHAHRRPYGFGSVQTLLQAGAACAFHAWTSPLPPGSSRHRLPQFGIQA